MKDRTNRGLPMVVGAAKRAPCGFSLVELLAVMLVVSILMTIGVMGVRNLANGKSVTAAVANAEGVFEEARLLALGRGTTARVLVHADVNNMDPSLYLRQMLIVFRNPEEDRWELEGGGYLLPEGIFFSRELSRKNHAAGGDRMDTTLVENGPQRLQGEYAYYEFNSEGICSTPGASFIVGSGGRRQTEEEPRVTGNTRDFGGFVVWRNGSTSVFRGINQMGEVPESNETF